MVEDGAAALAALGARFVVVGSAARRLLGDDVLPRDLDVVPDPDDGGATLAAVRALALGDGWPVGADLLAVPTSFGPVDVFHARTPGAWRSLVASSVVVAVAGMPVRVARG